MTNDPFTEWLTNRFLFYRRRKNDLLLSEKERIQAEAKETECADCIYQYRQLAPTWIPVTPETMPEEGTYVLIHGKGGRRIAALVRDGRFEAYDIASEYLEECEEVTHWMPLPAPPIK